MIFCLYRLLYTLFLAYSSNFWLKIDKNIKRLTKKNNHGILVISFLQTDTFFTSFCGEDETLLTTLYLSGRSLFV